MYWSGQASKYTHESRHKRCGQNTGCTKMMDNTKSGEIAAFTRLHTLNQDCMSLSEYINEVTKTVELCNYTEKTHWGGILKW